jgi:type I restriction enzyme S subunit
MVVQSQFIEMFGNPMGDEQKYPLKRLGDCCVINPKRSKVTLSDSDLVSFVPMPSVSEEGYLQDVSDSEYGSVKKGFTYFENGDVLFAKITPCMENGKGAIAHDLTNGIGMGSTEFHVLRPIDGKSNSYWIFTLTRLPEFREKAAHNMSGTGGQQRVRSDFLESFMIGLPPIELQNDLESICRHADKSKFDSPKSQFIEMFRTAPKEHVHLKDIATYSIGLTYKPDNVKSTGIPVLRSGNIQEESLDFADLVRVNTSIPDTLLLRDGDILMCSRNGSAHLVGKVARIRQLPEPMTFGAFMTVIRSEYMDYLFLFFQSEGFRQQISYGKSSTMNQITQKMLDQISLDLPSKTIISRISPLLEQADKSKFELKQAIEKIDKVMRALMQ